MSEDDQIRRLLADARHTEPIPPDVAERLDGALADLRADRPLRPTVTDLAAARRRRRARTMLIAAAAVIVVGVGVNQVRGMEVSGGDDANSADAGSSQASAGGDAAAERTEADAPVDGGAFDAENEVGELSGRAARVTATDFGSAALELRDQRESLRRYLLYQSSADAVIPKDGCVDGGWGRGRTVRVRYDGSPAVLVYRPPRGETQVVDLYVCGLDEVVRTITLPAR